MSEVVEVSGSLRPSSARRSRVITPRERRSVRKIRFSRAEWEVVEAHAHACGRAPARHVREMALGVVPRISQTRANARLIRELSGLVTELQCARAAIAAEMNGPLGDVAMTRTRAVVTVLERAADTLLASIERLA